MKPRHLLLLLCLALATSLHGQDTVLLKQPGVNRIIEPQHSTMLYV